MSHPLDETVHFTNSYAVHEVETIFHLIKYLKTVDIFSRNKH